MNRAHRMAALVLWSLVVLAVGAIVGGGATADDGPHRAGLVVVGEDGAMHQQCVEFEEGDISGVELLRRSGLAVVFSASVAFGEGVCSLDGTGCNDPGDCFCQCRGADCAYWAYFGLGEFWTFQAIGPSQRRLRDGDVDGWIWGGGRVPPDPVAFADICPYARAAPTATLVAAPTRAALALASVVPARPTSTPAAAPNAQTGAPGQQDGETSATATATPTAATGDERVVARPDDAGDDAPAAGLGVADEDGGVPAGLIAFGAVAGGLVAVVGGLALRRRLHG